MHLLHLKNNGCTFVLWLLTIIADNYLNYSQFSCLCLFPDILCLIAWNVRYVPFFQNNLQNISHLLS